ncbi:hypothetical protein V492_06836 [Pseudogymnoascus sp. VKM F-4246]|nr:hypothetical protein V492_06836 [Pseudogymnoascus sp. VKM F-4246]
MDTTQDISESLGQLHLPARLAKPSLSPLLNLPPEILLLIASFLPLEPMGSLSLSCRHLYLSLKNEYLQPLKDADSNVMIAFLQLLERDLPLHIVCPQCNKLHFTPLAQRYQVSDPYNYTDRAKWPKCRAIDDLGRWSDNMTPSFSSAIFLMAMKAHRQDKDTTVILNLLSYSDVDDTSRSFAELHTSSARIRNGSLLMRDQRVFMFPAPLRIPLSVCAPFGFCAHNSLSNLAHLPRCGIHVPSADEIGEYENKEGIIYCRYCPTEIRIDFKSYGKDGTAVFVTRWMDVGEGRDMEDVKWKVRLGRFDWLRDEHSYARGAICAAFEGTDDFRFESLLNEEDEIDLITMCPVSWPEYEEVTDDEDEEGYVVKDGRLVSLPEEDSMCFCIHDD